MRSRLTRRWNTLRQLPWSPAPAFPSSELSGGKAYLLLKNVHTDGHVSAQLAGKSIPAVNRRIALAVFSGAWFSSDAVAASTPQIFASWEACGC
jgi:hypothetical protein